MGTRFSPYWRVYQFQRTNTFNNQHNIPLRRWGISISSFFTQTAFPFFLVDIQEERRKRSNAIRYGKFGEALGLGSHSIERRETRFCLDNTLRPDRDLFVHQNIPIREYYKLSKILEFSQRISQRRYLRSRHSRKCRK